MSLAVRGYAVPNRLYFSLCPLPFTGRMRSVLSAGIFADAERHVSCRWTGGRSGSVLVVDFRGSCYTSWTDSF